MHLFYNDPFSVVFKHFFNNQPLPNDKSFYIGENQEISLIYNEKKYRKDSPVSYKTPWKGYARRMPEKE